MTAVAWLSMLEITAALGAFMAAVLIVRVAFARRTIHFWINILSSMWLSATACELLLRALSESAQSTSTPGALARAALSVTMLAVSGLVVPFSNRILKSKGYDELSRATDELQKEDRLFDSFINALPWPVFIKDRRGRFVFVNDRMVPYSGFSKKQLIGQSMREWGNDALAAFAEEKDNQLFATNTKQQFPSFTLQQGLVTLFPLPLHGGAPLLGGIISDTTAQFRLEAEANILASIVEHASDAIYTIAPDTRITSWNRGAQETFGYHPEEIIGQPLATITPRERQHEAEEWRQLIDRGESIVDYPTLRTAKDGTCKHVLVSACKILSLRGKGYEYAGITRDITALKQAEQELLSINKELAVRAEELVGANAALQAARDEALTASNMKSAFVSNVSHELRTPLSGVLGLSELLLQQPMENDARETLRTIHDSAVALLSIINDILDLSKLEAGTITLNLKPFSPADVVRECAILLSTAARAKGLTINVSLQDDLPSQLYGDAGRLEQVLLNLGGNAIKFTDQGNVTISAEVLSQGKHQTTIMFSVEDSGIGIEEADRANLFYPFTRIEKSTRGIVGTGLGLVISKRLIELMGGEINLISEPHQGSTFWFWVPLGTVPEESKVSSPLLSALTEHPELLSRHRILVVEDNAVLSELAARQLAMLGAPSDCVFNGEDALCAWRNRKYDIILLDIHLPDISGHEVARRIRSAQGRGSNGRPVIIAMTAGAMPGDREKALESGMNDYLAKPVNLAQLGETVFKWATALEAQRADNSAAAAPRSGV